LEESAVEEKIKNLTTEDKENTEEDVRL